MLSCAREGDDERVRAVTAATHADESLVLGQDLPYRDPDVPGVSGTNRST